MANGPSTEEIKRPVIERAATGSKFRVRPSADPGGRFPSDFFSGRVREQVRITVIEDAPDAGVVAFPPRAGACVADDELSKSQRRDAPAIVLESLLSAT